MLRRALAAGYDASEAAEIIRWVRGQMLKRTQAKAAARDYGEFLTHPEKQRLARQLTQPKQSQLEDEEA